MQLTGRTLALAAAACIIGGAAFGVVTSIATAAQGQGQAAPTTPASSELGDEVVSFPLPTTSVTPSSSMPSLAPTPDPTFTAGADPVEPAPTVTVTVTAEPSAPSTPTPRPTTAPSTAAGRADSASGRANNSPSPRFSTQQTRPAVPASPKPQPTRAAKARAPEAKPNVVRETKPKNGWQPPGLQVGNNNITAPRLTSGADVGTFVACGPSTACTVSGNVLFISPEATSVTVTWSADPAHGYPRWWASTDFSR